MKFIPKALELTYSTIIDFHNIASHNITVKLNESKPEEQINDLLHKFAAQHEIPCYTNTYITDVKDINKYHNGDVKVEMNTNEVNIIYELNVALTYTCEL